MAHSYRGTQDVLGSLGEGLIREGNVRPLVTEFSDMRARMAEGRRSGTAALAEHCGAATGSIVASKQIYQQPLRAPLVS